MAEAPDRSTIVVPGDGGAPEEARRIASVYGLRFAVESDPLAPFLLEVTADRVQLRDNRRPKLKPLWVDLDSTRLRRRLRGGDRLLRAACRVRDLDRPVLLDATAGMGEDALLLASMGFDVAAVERSPVVVALLADGLARLYGANRPTNPIELTHADAATILADQFKDGIPPDVVFLDPMFNEAHRGALPGKAMEILGRLLPDDAGSAALFNSARLTARRKTVVKRRLSAPALGPGADYSVKGTQIRYDVYLA